MKFLRGFTLAVLFLQGCAMVGAGRHQTASLSKIKLDMPVEKVRKVMGRPDMVRVGKRIAEGKVYELHEYKLYSSACVKALSMFLILPAYPLCGAETLWLHYINSDLVFWGEKGDWRGTPKGFSSLYSGGPTMEQSKVDENFPRPSDLK